MGADVMNVSEIEEKIDNYDILIFADTSTGNTAQCTQKLGKTFKILEEKRFWRKKSGSYRCGD